MRHTLQLAPQFYVTAPQECPYLEGRKERKLFTALQGDWANELNSSLSKQGFRRSQNVLYRPSCADCSSCMSARVDVSRFTATKSQRRVERRNDALDRRTNSPWATEDQYDLFRRYLSSRHANGGMADMDVFEFANMIEETPIKTRVIEYSDDKTRDLAAVCLTDILDDGVSMVYSFFDPALAAQSLGTYVILDHIRIAQENDLPYVYLGYWVPGSPKMGYKSKFSGLEIFRGNEWVPVHDPTLLEQEDHPLEVVPIAEQVSNIKLPGVRTVK
ncbi:MAG: arginyltransferase [Paracoccaceae bacterium]|jgi:leucyl-tRNA---protein transferase|nr:arginyltransferase [Paracoccaceae bacterium]